MRAEMDRLRGSRGRGRRRTQGGPPVEEAEREAEGESQAVRLPS